MKPTHTIALAVALSAMFGASFAVAQSFRGIPRPTTAGVGEAADSHAAAGERVINLPLGDGERQRILYVAPNLALGTIIMLPGGTGDVGIQQDGDLRHGDNFVVRTRALWAAKGYAVLIPDTLNRSNLRGVRSSPQYARLVATLIDYARSQVHGPVFLLGTSQGSIAAMNGAAHAPLGSVAGVVLTESVSRLGASHETVFDADPQDVRVAALVVSNMDDQCDVAPPQDAPKIAAALNHSPDVHILTLKGGIDRSGDACGSRSPHGYYGMEAQVVEAITHWMRDHG